MRPLAIELAFDTDSDRRLSRIWSALAAMHGGPERSELGVAPHVTLALFRGGAPASDLGAAVDALVEQVIPFTLDLATADRFPTGEGVVFLRPRPSVDLTHAHLTLHRLLADDRNRVDAYYRPEVWQPHCTMAVDVTDDLVAPVLAACRSSAAIGPVRITRVQLIQYRPATVIASYDVESPSFEIRRARESDLDGICEAHVRGIREVCVRAYAPAQIAAWAGRLFPGIHREALQTNDVFVAVEAGRVLGFGQLDRATGEVVGCYVHPNALRRRVGTLLLAMLEKAALQSGLPRLRLDASLNAVAFYRQAGFVGEGESRHTLEGGVEIACVRMSKPLRDC